MSEPLRFELEGAVAIVTMDDGKANALSHVMLDALIDAVGRAERDAKAMVLVGRPEKFSAGFDLKVMMSGPENAIALLTKGSDLLMRLYGCQVPLVIACTGHALAGGALAVLTGDVRLGTTGAYRIGLNEVTIGLPVPVLAMELARDRLLPSELTNATLLAKIYDPAAAVQAGYLDAVVGADALLGRAREEATRLSALGRHAFAATKARLRGKTIAHIRATLDEDVRTLLVPAG